MYNVATEIMTCLFLDPLINFGSKNEGKYGIIFASSPTWLNGT